jgi:hypothetical protein
MNILLYNLAFRIDIVVFPYPGRSRQRFQVPEVTSNQNHQTQYLPLSAAPKMSSPTCGKTCEKPSFSLRRHQFEALVFRDGLLAHGGERLMFAMLPHLLLKSFGFRRASNTSVERQQSTDLSFACFVGILYLSRSSNEHPSTKVYCTVRLMWKTYL